MAPVARARVIVVLGVSGSGKSTVGRSVAQRLEHDFCDADDLHSQGNIEKMASGQPLSDEERRPWLNAVGRRILEILAQHNGVVIACSALKKSYRDIIRDYEPSTFFVLLSGSRELILSRVVARKDSFMPPQLLPSQIATLEPLDDDEVGVTIDVAQELEAIVQQILTALSTGENPEHNS